MFEYSRKQSSSFSFVSLIPVAAVIGLGIFAFHMVFGR